MAVSAHDLPGALDSPAVSGWVLADLNYTGETWAEDTATQGCDRSADSGAGIPRERVSTPARSLGPGNLAKKR